MLHSPGLSQTLILNRLKSLRIAAFYENPDFDARVNQDNRKFLTAQIADHSGDAIGQPGD